MESIAKALEALSHSPWFVVLGVVALALVYALVMMLKSKAETRIKLAEIEIKRKELAAKNERSEKFNATIANLTSMVYQQSMALNHHTEDAANRSSQLCKTLDDQTGKITGAVKEMGDAVGNRLMILAAESRGYIGSELSCLIFEDKVRLVFLPSISRIVTKTLTENHFAQRPQAIRAKVIAYISDALKGLKSSIADYNFAISFDPLFKERAEGSFDLAHRLWGTLQPFYNGTQFDLQDRIVNATEKLESSVWADYNVLKNQIIDGHVESTDVYKALTANTESGAKKYNSSADIRMPPNAGR